MNFTPERLSAIKAKTLIVSGAATLSILSSWPSRWTRAIPHSSLWIIPDGLHLPVFLAERERFARVAVSFLGAWAEGRYEGRSGCVEVRSPSLAATPAHCPRPWLT
jgi:hypothetical protein